ncbi:MAG: LOG family protein [Actinomycetota bacterium]|nr:LOG family protein [Actinomycetota bacterium]
MARLQGRGVEVESLADFDALVERGGRAMAGWRVQALDLRERSTALLRLDPSGALLLGCALDPLAEQHLRAGGALVFPAIPDTPFDTYRATLYSADELYAGLSDATYPATPDARIYAWSRQPGADLDVGWTLARALHDHAIDDALGEALTGRNAVGVMGGHAWSRGDHAYAEAARLGRLLARSGLYVATGGGPGAMEAANLGAYLSTADDPALEQALRMLAGVPSFQPSVTEWARAAFAVRSRWPEGADSIGIPTWFYGHEPPNPFASLIAKYFQNALREDTLLRYCDAGIVFLPGAAGTVQEIFQDACENYYADAAAVAPMVLVGREHWTDVVPAWPLLSGLARGRAMQAAVHLVDSVDEVAALLADGSR